MSLNVLKREDFLYRPCYCEENIWQLCQHEQFKNSQVIFIASKGEVFPMLNQRAMVYLLKPVFWDYHVILLAKDERNQILDFDTCLSFSTDVAEYFRNSFMDNALLSADEQPWFRVVPADEYTALFCSDRSHMKTASGWQAPPPSWPPIGNGAHNLSSFTDMNNSTIGEVLSFDAMLRVCRI
ncbi:MAG: hypothetical protein PF589_11165 [Gammaproteobacteria bacterium]|jgi:hypothetical protein|nr:hypothetical protein [Gammaproteobacteria bacterium]